ncbi:LacI family DNA-binding transcriptional regulator [Oceanobacillus sp. CFH 90083]|uniref:LacI family DNA-binding transcriptional regulator n=1 Tax=Oceanobacillus sp. CFH 90083 TaxID=2592336 RepID=UPI00128C1BCF|nr:LacI family DNA-binding transcriptional regulator [Oceanobacillus sp. CFH 90083]
MAVTLKDIARECGVSYSTVSKALKDSPLVTQATKRKIKEKAEEMNYIPNNSARSLVSNKSHTIGLIWPAVDRVAVTTLATQVNEALKQAGYFMAVSIDNPITAASKFLELRFDGVIVFDEGESTTLPEKITKNIPVIAYGVARKLPYPIINVHHNWAMKQAVDLLIEKGYQSIDYIGELHTKDIRQIVKKKTIEDYCREKQVTYRLIDSGGLTEMAAKQAVKEFLKTETLHDGIICGSYDITMGVLHHMDDLELEKTIVAYDNIKQFKSIETPVYSVGVSAEQIAESLVKHLTKNIEAGRKNASEVIDLFPTLQYHDKK